ncbi:monovalent cation/H+ antiporter complex subunit F [Salana multivorans]
MNIVVLVVCGVMVATGAAFAFYQVERGPSMLDRVVALDVVVAAVLATLALVSAHTKRTDLVPVMVVLTLVGFIGSVTIARFASRESDDERRILTREEARALEEQRRREEEEEAAREHPEPSVRAAAERARTLRRRGEER